MKANIHFLSYIAQFLLKWETFQVKVVEKTKTCISYSITSPPPPQNHSIYEDNVEKYCGARQATDANIGAYTLHAGFLILQTHTQNM
jgi:hypothetical protein